MVGCLFLDGESGGERLMDELDNRILLSCDVMTDFVDEELTFFCVDIAIFLIDMLEAGSLDGTEVFVLGEQPEVGLFMLTMYGMRVMYGNKIDTESYYLERPLWSRYVLSRAIKRYRRAHVLYCRRYNTNCMIFLIDVKAEPGFFTPRETLKLHSTVNQKSNNTLPNIFFLTNSIKSY